MIKTIPEKKRCEKAKWLSEEAIEMSEKRRDSKGKGEKGKVYSFQCRVLKNIKVR